MINAFYLLSKINAGKKRLIVFITDLAYKSIERLFHKKVLFIALHLSLQLSFIISVCYRFQF